MNENVQVRKDPEHEINSSRSRANHHVGKLLV